ncbi:MAG: phosphodiester glycosidase family protein [Candidatus Moraniibacteriota bacterium]
MDSLRQKIRSPKIQHIQEHNQKVRIVRKQFDMPIETMDCSNEKRPRKFQIYQKFKFTALIILVLLISGVIFIKLNTAAAAYLTDNILRPVVGDKNIVFLEKIYFNASDFVERLTHNSNFDKPPIFNEDSSQASIAGSELNLMALSTAGDDKPLAGEGQWKNLPLKMFPDKEVMAHTFLRPDSARSYAITTVVQIDKQVLRMGIVAGTKQPGGPVGKPGPGIVPKDIVSGGKLIAAFDGGFQYKDGAYGMIVGGNTYLPLRSDLGTIIGYKDGTLKIIDYTGQPLGDNVEFVRQNCPILISNGAVAAGDPRNKKLWGRLAAGTVDILTWRSGLGLTKQGNLLFAVGNNLTPITLANALKTAGAVDAIQLDINPIWVRFNIFNYLGNGKYNSIPLTKDLQDGSKQYLNGYEKDFFYLYAN